MNKKLLLAALALIIVIGAGFTFVTLKKDTGTDIGTVAPENKKTQPDPAPKSQAPTAGKYVDYTEKDFASTEGTRLLFFHAPWCPQCRALDKSIQASTLPEGVTIFRVDYDSQQSLRATYGVTLQTTVVKVDEKGDKLDSYVAYDKPSFQSVKQALLP